MRWIHRRDRLNNQVDYVIHLKEIIRALNWQFHKSKLVLFRDHVKVLSMSIRHLPHNELQLSPG